jgi:hypothetical protein
LGGLLDSQKHFLEIGRHAALLLPVINGRRHYNATIFHLTRCVSINEIPFSPVYAVVHNKLIACGCRPWSRGHHKALSWLPARGAAAASIEIEPERPCGLNWRAGSYHQRCCIG